MSGGLPDQTAGLVRTDTKWCTRSNMEISGVLAITSKITGVSAVASTNSGRTRCLVVCQTTKLVRTDTK